LAPRLEKPLERKLELARLVRRGGDLAHVRAVQQEDRRLKVRVVKNVVAHTTSCSLSIVIGGCQDGKVVRVCTKMVHSRGKESGISNPFRGAPRIFVKSGVISLRCAWEARRWLEMGLAPESPAVEWGGVDRTPLPPGCLGAPASRRLRSRRDAGAPRDVAVYVHGTAHHS